MPRQRSSERIADQAIADVRGLRAKFKRLAPDRIQRLNHELVDAMRGEEIRHFICLKRAEGFRASDLADPFSITSTSMERRTETGMKAERVHLLASLVDESLTLWNGALISMRTSRPLTSNSRPAYLVALPQRQSRLRKRPDRERLVQLIKHEKDLVELAGNPAHPRDPHVACGRQGKQWLVDFVILCRDMDEATDAAHEQQVTTILVVPSGRVLAI